MLLSHHSPFRNVVHGGAGESHDLRLGTGRVPTAVNDGITNALIGGIGQNGVGIHEPAQFKYEEHNRNDHPHHQCGFDQGLTTLAVQAKVSLFPHPSKATSWRLGDEISDWLAELR